MIVPAHDEAGYIGACLDALFASVLDGAAMQVIVVANGCTDATARIARGYAQPGRDLAVIELAEGGKLGALECGDAAAQYGTRIYLDADVIASPHLIAQLIAALEARQPRYASGRPVVTRARTGITRAYARFWQTLPFVASDVPGFGIFAVNAAGRARWGAWPDIISDDTFVRLNFTPAERISVPATYTWPMVEGWRNLVRVRRRQDRGVGEIAVRYPDLLRNDSKARPGLRGIAARGMRDPTGFAVYAAVALAVKLPGASGWVRGR
ncbi:glycosyltransferase family 2 protein [Roseovarius dicentrarchi]|uniref:glycosyltransferase family 2 protein n=1 Tax=Roseovarius dicentrarchi TaxID=2250573 RepID=UPI001EF067BB|nr:glycosyltransferase [Roseovarius dicentrarchi]